MTAEPSLELGGAPETQPIGRPAAELRRWAAGTLVGLLWCAALLIGWRRLAGTINIPLQPVWLLLVGGLVAVAAAGLRLVLRFLPAHSPCRLPDWLIPLLATAAVLGLGAALSLRGTDTRGLIAFWAVLLGEELWAWRPAMWRSPPDQAGALRPPRRAGVRPVEQPAGHRLPAALNAGSPASGYPASGCPASGYPGDDVLQQLTRSQAADGSEQLSGWLRVVFAAGQRTAIVHLAFCPQFATTPELAVEQLDGPEILRINQAVFCFGARLDLKLAAPAEEPLGVRLQFSARSKPLAPAPTSHQSTP
jgi:hypothetical protein